MITRLPLLLISLLALVTTTAPLAAQAAKPVREVRFFFIGDAPALTLAEGMKRKPLQLAPYALSTPQPLTNGRVLLYSPGGDPAVPVLDYTPLSDIEQLVAVLAPGATAAEPVKLVGIWDISPKTLNPGQVRVANLLPVEMALMMGQDRSSLAPSATRVFAPALSAEDGCDLKVAYANPRGEGYLRLKEGGVWLPAPTRMLAVAVLTQRPTENGAAALLKPEWLAFRL